MFDNILYINAEDVLFLLSQERDFNHKIISIIELEESSISSNSLAKLSNIKRHFRLNSTDGKDFHLSLGAIPLNAWNQLNFAYNKLQDFVCKPIFFKEFEGYNILIQEYFEGIPLDLALEKNISSNVQATNILKIIFDAFDKIKIKSSREKLHQEIDFLANIFLYFYR